MHPDFNSQNLHLFFEFSNFDFLPKKVQKCLRSCGFFLYLFVKNPSNLALSSKSSQIYIKHYFPKFKRRFLLPVAISKKSMAKLIISKHRYFVYEMKKLFMCKTFLRDRTCSPCKKSPDLMTRSPSEKKVAKGLLETLRDSWRFFFQSVSNLRDFGTYFAHFPH